MRILGDFIELTHADNREKLLFSLSHIIRIKTARPSNRTTIRILDTTYEVMESYEEITNALLAREKEVAVRKIVTDKVNRMCGTRCECGGNVLRKLLSADELKSGESLYQCTACFELVAAIDKG